MRCDRVDFEPGGIAYRHTHPGPGIRYLLFGAITIDSLGAEHTLGPGEAWFERGPDPVLATTAAGRALGLRTRHAAARGVGRPAHDPLRRSRRRRQAQDPARDDLPRAAGARVDAQRRAGPGRPARAARGRPGLRRARRELPGRPRRAPRRAAAARSSPATRAARRTWPRPTASSPAARACAWSRAGRGRRTPPTACTPRFRTRRRCCCSSGRWRATPSGARASRSSTTAPCTGRSRSGRRRSTTPRACPRSSPARSPSRPPGGPGRS